MTRVGQFGAFEVSRRLHCDSFSQEDDREASKVPQTSNRTKKSKTPRSEYYLETSESTYHDTTQINDKSEE
eukprot:scaffold9047_cov76-Skeletonema_dohrnii-CCMP3373.AAC.1